MPVSWDQNFYGKWQLVWLGIIRPIQVKSYLRWEKLRLRQQVLDLSSLSVQGKSHWAAWGSRTCRDSRWHRTGKQVPTLLVFDFQPLTELVSVFPPSLFWTWLTAAFIWFRFALLLCFPQEHRCLGCCNIYKAFGCIYVYWNVLFMVQLHTPFPLFSLLSSHLKTSLLKAEGKNN